MRVGDSREIAPDLSFVAATNRDLKAMVAKGLFRADLFHRIREVLFDLPDLSERPEDIPLLAYFFFWQEKIRYNRDCQLSVTLLQSLQECFFDGNVRGLRIAIKDCVRAAREGQVITELQPRRARRRVSAYNIRANVGAKEKALIIKALKKSNGIQKKAALLCDMAPSTFRFKMNKYGIDHRKYRGRGEG